MGRHKRLIEGSATLTQFEEIQNLRNDAIRAFERDRKAHEERRQVVVKQWLSPCDYETQQNRHRSTRSICIDSGRWLLESSQFQKWFSPDYCSTPLLWLSGIPGAGMALNKH